jgi:hypothetical protein
MTARTSRVTRTTRRLGHTWLLAGFISTVLLTSAVLASCGGAPTSVGYMKSDSSAAVFLQWTRSGNTVSGLYQMAGPIGGNLRTLGATLTGSISGSSVTLNISSASLGRQSELKGTLNGGALHLDGVGDLKAATLADFDAAVVALVPQASQEDLSGQTGSAREASLKEGIHSIQVGIQSWAIDNNDTYPQSSEVTPDQSGVGQYVDKWPTNPYTGQPMTQGTTPGDFSYTLGANSTSYSLVGYGENGYVFTAN